MKRSLSGLLRQCAVAAIILGGMFTLGSPALMAQRRGGFSGGHSYQGSGGRGFVGGGQRFSTPSPSYRGGRSYGGGYYRSGGGRYYGGGYYRGGGGRYYGGNGYGYGYYCPYVYGYAYPPAYCAPSGYYDQWGRWIVVPGCAVSPYVDPYGY